MTAEDRVLLALAAMGCSWVAGLELAGPAGFGAAAVVSLVFCAVSPARWWS